MQFQSSGEVPENSSIDVNDTLTWKFEHRWSEGSNILGMIVASLVFGKLARMFY